MNWYKTAQLITTKKTKLDTLIPLTVEEILALNDYLDDGKKRKLVDDVILRIVRENAGIIRMQTEGRIRDDFSV